VIVPSNNTQADSCSEFTDKDLSQHFKETRMELEESKRQDEIDADLEALREELAVMKARVTASESSHLKFEKKVKKKEKETAEIIKAMEGQEEKHADSLTHLYGRMDMVELLIIEYPVR